MEHFSRNVKGQGDVKGEKLDLILLEVITKQGI
jgi:hypothetical protein